MTRTLETRLLQIVVAVACLVPLDTGGTGIIRGAAMLRGMPQPVPADVDSHFRYLCGIFFVLGCAFVSCIPDIARKGPRFRLLGTMVLAGGLARLLSLLTVGMPSAGHIFGLGMELGVVPLLMLWQARVARAAR